MIYRVFLSTVVVASRDYVDIVAHRYKIDQCDLLLTTGPADARRIVARFAAGEWSYFLVLEESPVKAQTSCSSTA